MKSLYLLTIFGYTTLLWLTGIYVTRRSKSSDAYLVASRGLSVPFISVLIAGTWIWWCVYCRDGPGSIHPIWLVTIYVFLVMLIGVAGTRKK